jgi:two-component system, OmpR family, sensor histidine kinase KdpD
MRRWLSIEWRRLALTIAGTAAALAATTVLVALIEQQAQVPNASAVYLLAVVVAAVAFGTLAATAASVAAFLLYTYLFTEPLYTFSVVDPGEWVTVVLLLVIGTVVGQLAAGQRNRAEAAEHREREARALVEVSRALATRDETSSAASEIASVLCREGRMDRVWIASITESGVERSLADSELDAPFPRPSTYQALQRAPGPAVPRWTRIRNPVQRDDGSLAGRQVFRVAIEAGGRTLGALWALRQRDAGPPRTEETRMLAAAADQIGQAIEQDRLRADATSAELARRSDALKSALLDSVSHDLRTPLASIRAAAGSLMDRTVGWSADDETAIVTTIDREAERLNRLVTNLLDVSRIEAGGLRADFEPYALDDIVETAVARLRSSLGGRILTIDIPPDIPPVSVDATFIDQAITNVLENALKYVPEGAQIRIVGAIIDPTLVRLVVEDGGPGVPAGSLARLFDKFYRVPRPGEGSRKGTGIGLTVVRGLVETMGGTVSAGPSELGGLAIAIELPIAATPALAGPASEVGAP